MSSPDPVRPSITLLPLWPESTETMESINKRQKVIVVGAGPVGSLAAIYAAQRGHDVEIYELRGGKGRCFLLT